MNPSVQDFEHAEADRRITLKSLDRQALADARVFGSLLAFVRSLVGRASSIAVPPAPTFAIRE
jgi:hypothetical protein